jgi:hypothetical protein
MDFDRHNLQPEDAGGMVDGDMDDTYIDHTNSALDWSECEIARLKAENARLKDLARELTEFIFTCGVRDGQRMRDLADENARLRDLVREMGKCIHIGAAQDEQGLRDRARETGIEVPE